MSSKICGGSRKNMAVFSNLVPFSEGMQRQGLPPKKCQKSKGGGISMRNQKAIKNEDFI